MRIGLWLVVASFGCGGPSSSPLDLRKTVAEFPVIANRNLDLLLVIDDTLSDEQFNLGRGVPTFLDRLGSVIPGGLPDLHIGVITSDLGTKASGSPTPAPDVGTVGQGGCSGTGKGGRLTTGLTTAVTGNFLSDIKLPDGSRQKNYDGQLSDVLRDMVRVGAAGCGFEQPLASMRAALDNNPANAGFLRSEALLAVLFLTDEDDCSVKDPALFAPDTVSNPLQSFRCTRFGVTCLQDGNTPDEMNRIGGKGKCGPNAGETGQLDDMTPFHDFLLGLKGDPKRIIVGGIFGDTFPFRVETRTVNGQSESAVAHSCTYEGPDGAPSTPDDQFADPGVRLQAFADLFSDRSMTASICHRDLAPPLEELGQLIAFGVGTPCVSAPLVDVDPAVADLQPDCIVEDLVGDSATEIPACASTSEDTCWQLLPDPAQCPRLDHLRLFVMRTGSEPDPATITQMRCLVQ